MLETTIRNAVLQAINKVGLSNFKKTSLFISGRKKV